MYIRIYFHKVIILYKEYLKYVLLIKGIVSRFVKEGTTSWIRFILRVRGGELLTVNVNKVYKNCPIVINDKEFPVDFIALPFREFDLILGMDCLSKHRVIVDYDKRSVVLKCSDQTEVTVYGI